MGFSWAITYVFLPIETVLRVDRLVDIVKAAPDERKAICNAVVELNALPFTPAHHNKKPVSDGN